MSDLNGPLALAQNGLAAFETYKTLDYDEPPTPAQRHALSGWAGWGPLAKAVDSFRYQELTGGWKNVADTLTELLSPEEERAAKEATATSFYTTPAITGSVWDIVTRLGFTGGRVLEPGCGGGNFITATPPDLDVDWTGVEIDPTSAHIARKLHPHARIINAPLERTAFRMGAFAAAVGNVPFGGSGQVYDPTWPADAGFKPPLHWYFLWRAVKALHPGGLAVLVTSRYTMDGKNPAARRLLSQDAEFVGAIRLPSKAFSELGFAGLADIVVLRRRPYGAENTECGAWETARENDELLTSINDYWFDNPHLVLGEMRPKGGARNGHTLDVIPADRDDPEDLLHIAVGRLVNDAVNAGLTWHPAEEGDAVADSDVEVLTPGDKEGSFHLADTGEVTQLIDGRYREVKACDELKELILLRDAALELFEADADLERSDSDVQPLREHTLTLYRGYVDRYGPLNRSTITVGPEDPETGHRTYRRITPALGGFRGVDRKDDNRPGDPDYPTVLALGVWNDDTQTEKPADILLRRVNKAPVRKQRADNPADAVALCWDEHARLDLPTLARLMDLDVQAVPAALAGLAFEDPEAGEWVTSEEYLSGNVREKLRTAEKMAERDADRWGGNVTALQQVQPVDLNASEIYAHLGSPWIPAGDVQTFIMNMFGLGDTKDVEIRHEPYTASWEVRAPKARKHPSATTRWGTAEFNAVDLIEKALNGSSPVVYDTVQVPDPNKPGRLKDKRVRNHALTQLAEERTKTIQELFGEWIWLDPERTDRLCRDYNWMYNAIRLRKFDGSMFTFPGLSQTFTPYKHQRDMVARIVASPATICAHSVGAGKTAAAFLSALTLKRLGMIRKPVITVPNHLLEQVTAEGRRLFPGARILMVTKSDLTPHRRKYFAARVASTDWDAVVMTHQQFTSIPVSPHLEAAYLADQIEALEKAVAEGEGLDDSRTVKRLAAQIMKLKARHAELTTWQRGKDNGLYFDLLGIDYVFADEFHMFKNLACPTRMEGFSMPASKRAEDMFIKVSWLRDRNPGGRCFAGFTGTPISNTLAEGYTLLRYAMSRQWLADKRIASFDAFGGAFIVYESKIEVSPDGAGFRMHRRPSKFVNVPELRLMLGESMDVRTRHQLKLAGPGRVLRETIKTPGQPEMAPFVQTLVERADAIRRGKPIERWSESKGKVVADNMLSVCNDGRKAALWLPLVYLDGTGPNKLDAVAERVSFHYHDNKDRLWPDADTGMLFGEAAPGALQLVFCDLGTPRKDDAQVYGELCDLIVDRGVPRRMVRFAHDAKTDLERAFLFAACRSGEVAVLLVSTEKGGTGVNVQDRLVAIHHVDAPWRPADVEQRDGRGIRPGNLCETIFIYRYVTEGSFDSYMWQHLERKSYFVFQILSGELDARQVDDLVSDDTLDYASIKAIATGKETVMELAKAQAEEARLKNLAVAYQRDRTRMKGDQAGYLNAARRHDDNAAILEKIGQAAADAERHYITYQATVADEERIAELLAMVGRKARKDRAQREAGTWRGVKVRFRVSWHYGSPLLDIDIAPGSAYRWVVLTGAHPDLLKQGREGQLLRFIDRAIDKAAGQAPRERDAAEEMRRRAEMIEPELFKPFEFEEEMKAAVARREALEAEIAGDTAAILPKDAVLSVAA